MAISKTDINPATGKMYAVNPATGVFDDNYWATAVEPKLQGASSPSAPTSSFSPTDVIANATKLQNFYREQNQPVIAATEATKAPLQQRYSDLLASIKANQQTAENRQTVTTQNELGKRGITSSSGIAQTELTNALNPITSQFTQMGKDTTNQENIDLAAINKAIAALQAGNPEASISTATGLAQQERQAQQFQQELEAKQRQAAIENALKQTQASQPNTAVVEAGGRKLLINQLTGETIRDLGSSASGAGAIDFSVGASPSTTQQDQSDYVDFIVQNFGLQKAIEMGLVGQNSYAR